MTAGITADGFLGGRLTIRQPAKGYRAGVDPVLLAAAVRARAGDSVLELGSGVGTAALCLMARVAGLSVTGVEVQPDYADLARRNAAENGLPFEVVTADLANLPADLRARSFDHVIANPPYFDPAASTAAADPGRATALAGATPLAAWIDTALRRLRPGGDMIVIQRADRLPELLGACDSRIGSLSVLPIQGRAGRPADRIILQGKKGGRAAFRLLAPLTLHEGAVHDGDRDSYRPEIRVVLRDAAPLPVEWA